MMAISRKNARRISVDDREYIWAVSEDSGFSKLVVQAATGTGQKFECTYNWQPGLQEHTGDRLNLPTISPSMAANKIREARDKGWRPDALAKPPFTLQGNGSLE